MFLKNKRAFPVRLTAIHFFLVFACALFSFKNLTHWDGEWYRQIVEVGYDAVHSADPFAEGKGNVGFFPGFPLATYLVKKILSFGGDFFPTTAALLLTANGFALLFWIYLEKWLGLFSNEEAKNRNKILLLAIYPFSFFFYCAYTESLFAAMVIGFFYFSEKMIREERTSKLRMYLLLALVHGYFMNFTRLLGVVLMVYPLLRALQTREKVKPAMLVMAGALFGPVTFFAYCQWKFGAWDFYFQTEKAIWGTFVDWAKLFPPKTLFDFANPLHPNTLGKYVTIVTGVGLTVKLIRLLKEKHFFEPALAVVLSAGMMWGEYLLGRTSWDYVGMGRYLLPVFAMMLPFIDLKPKATWKWFLVALVLISFQIALALKFGRHGWVA